MTGSIRRVLLATACAVGVFAIGSIDSIGSAGAVAAGAAGAAGDAGAAGAGGASGAEQMTPKAAAIPAVGDMAPPFVLSSIAGGTVRLDDVLADGPVVLVMLRGWPGYQCPFCTRQFADFLANAEALKARSGRVVFVYPGPGDGLADHATAFTAGKDMPAHFTFLLDPDYTFTTAYGLRWDAPKETAYPTTFVLDARGRVTFVRTSREHGGRVPVADVLTALAAAAQ